MNKIYRLIIIALALFGTEQLLAQCKPCLNLQFRGNARDTSISKMHGTVVNATLTSDRFGNPNSAYQFNGVNTHITIPDDTSNDLSKTYTIMAWVKPDSGYGSFKDNHLTIVDKWGNAGPALAAYGMDIHSNGALEGITHTGSYGTYSYSNGIIQTNVWSHLAVVRKADDSISLYINGVLDRTYKSQLPQNSGFNLTVGMAADPSIQAAYPTYYRYSGIIDDIVIYKCPLAPSSFGLTITDVRDYQNFIHVFPNPNNGLLNIGQSISTNFEVKIIDMNGKTIQSGMNQSQFDLSASKGIYIVQFTDLDKGFVVSKKVVVQ